MSTTTHPPTFVGALPRKDARARERASVSPATPAPLVTLARRAIWALPIWALLLAVSTLTHQPSYDTDFPAYAEYVTTGHFLASHLVASILGAALGVVGAVAVVVLLAESPVVRRAFWGLSAFAIGTILNTSVFGVAAFFQPAIGDAFLAGNESVARSVNESVYGSALFATAGIGLVLWVLGLVLIGRALRRSGMGMDRAGLGFLVGAVGFAVAGFSFQPLQPVAGAALALAALAAARKLARAR